ARAALGVILMDKKQYQDASESLRRAVQLEPNSSEYTLAFAESLELSSHEHELLEFLKQVEPKFSNLPEFQYKLALAYYRATELSSAVATLQKLLQMNPRRKDRIYFILGNSYLTIGNYAEAEKAYRNAIEMNPKDPAYYEEFATLLRKEGPGRVGDAIAELKHALQFDPSNPRLALQLALCYESKGDLNSAVTLAEEAVRGQPEMLPAHVALARIYFRLGRKGAGQKEKETIAQLEQKQQQSLLPNSGSSRSADVRAQ
ncbi:MAG TPA: tetratricopeptide repeat protein, partial [Bryobacteraceae bacterium]|nr:tetratricopeptide repeat protein [Bryobacteraceae bacterium]